MSNDRIKKWNKTSQKKTMDPATLMTKLEMSTRQVALLFPFGLKKYTPLLQQTNQLFSIITFTTNYAFLYFNHYYFVAEETGCWCFLNTRRKCNKKINRFFFTWQMRVCCCVVRGKRLAWNNRDNIIILLSFWFFLRHPDLLLFLFLFNFYSEFCCCHTAATSKLACVPQSRKLFGGKKGWWWRQRRRWWSSEKNRGKLRKQKSCLLCEVVSFFCSGDGCGRRVKYNSNCPRKPRNKTDYLNRITLQWNTLYYN